MPLCIAIISQFGRATTEVLFDVIVRQKWKYAVEQEELKIPERVSLVTCSCPRLRLWPNQA